MADFGDSPAPPGTEPTLAGDPETLAMMRRIETTLFDTRERAVRIGRFALDRVLGSGGMGVVHLAHDDVLDRRVAIKLIRGEGVSEERRARLLREAKAMARLSHANVVQVYEAGEHAGRVFVAMELVEGRTLARWLLAEGMASPWRERLAVLVAAGRGLAAAHRAGLVHRDFKPDNVLLNDRREAKVADFGLVGVATEVRSLPSEPAVVDSLTVTGSLIGTPRYMAPEQLAGGVADARSDQFAFCIVAYETLVGERPFAGDTFAELSANVIDGVRRPVPRGCPVPRRLLAVIERGLEPDPQRRWPSMDALLAAMSERHGRAPMVTATLSVAGVLALGFAAQRFGGEAAGCDGASERLAGVWDAPRRDATAEAFRSSGKAYAADTFARITPVLDQYASAWSDADLGACTSAQAGDPTAAARTACLDHARAELQFVTDDLAMGEPHALLHAVDLVAALPEPGRCEDPEGAALDVGSLDDPELRAVVDGLAQAKVLLGSRRLTEADALLVELQAQAAAHRRDGLEGHALLLRSKAAQLRGVFEKSREHAAQALALAERVERDEMASIAWRALYHASVAREEHDRAAFELDRADSIALRAGAEPEMQAGLLYDRARLLGEVSRHGDALAEFRRAVAAYRELSAEHVMIADVLSDMAAVLLMSGQQDEAITVIEESIDTRVRQQGASHPTMKTALVLAANQYVAAGRFEDALRMDERALAIAKLYPEDRPTFIPVLAAMTAQNLVSLGRFDEAQEMLEHAEELAGQYAADNPDVHGYIGLALGNLHFDRREFALAIPRYETAMRDVQDGAWENKAIAASNLSYCLASLGRMDEALARTAEARAAIVRVAENSPVRVGIEVYDADVQRIAGNLEAARTGFRQVIATVDAVEVDPALRFMAHFGAARVEPDRELARAHVRKAAAELERMPSTAWQREELASWLAQHDP